MSELFIETILSPIGSIDLVVQTQGLVSVDFSDCRDRMIRLLEKRLGAVTLTPQSHPYSDRLRQYFNGNVEVIREVPLILQGTPFQNKVWHALSQVKPGKTLTYGDLARQINQPRAAQAVGRANALNPLLIFLPCHRIVGSDHKMVGYSGGIHRKQWLINHEQQSQGQVNKMLGI
jgi:methylated-DNA-[protein]-cysteine S-methyltransferase